MESEVLDSESGVSVDVKDMGYTVSVSPHIFNRLEQHILFVKRLSNRNETRQNWVLEAIRDKLTRDDRSQDVPKECRLNLKIDETTATKLFKRVELIKKFRTSYSKKQWILDAILERLERDEKKIKQKLLELES